MALEGEVSFGELLRRYRLRAALTQEELAERARLSAHAISQLERGARRVPRRDTVDLLAEALALTETERAAFEVAARRHKMQSGPPASAPALSSADAEVALQETVHAPAADTSPPADVPVTVQSETQLIRLIRLVLHALHARLTLLSAFAPLFLAQGKRRTALVGMLLVAVICSGTLFFAGEPGTTLAGLTSKTLCLASDMPIDDPALPITSHQDAINLAAAQSQDLGNGYTLKLIKYDDDDPTSLLTLDGDPQIGARNVQQMVRNPCIMAMVGPEYSLVAAAEMPIAANAGLVMISPSNTLSGLTLRPYAQPEGWDFDLLHPKGKPVNYFRDAPNGVAEGLAAADFTYGDLGARTAYVVTDREVFGEDLVGGFTQGMQFKGGRIAGIDSVLSTNLSGIADVAARIVETHTDAVFYAGPRDPAVLLKVQLDAQGYTGSFIGSEGIAADPSFLTVAGINSANSTFAIGPFSDPSSFTSGAAAEFVRAFHARYPDQTLAPDGAEHYDAAMVLITAMKHLIQAGQPVTRQAMIEQVQHIQYAGVIGPISFDTNGDIAHGVFSLYGVQDGKWFYVQQVRV